LSTERCQLKRTAKFGTICAMTEPAAKLRQLRISKGFTTAKEAAARFGWNVNTYKSHENGTRDISKKAAIDYAKAYKVLPGWLLLDSGPQTEDGAASREVYKGVLQSVPKELPQRAEQDLNLAYRKIPRLSWEIMANIANIAEVIAEAKEFYLTSADDVLPPLSFSLTIADDSMTTAGSISQTSFRPRDEIILSPQSPVVPGNFVIAKIFARNETVFRQYRENGRDKQGRKIVTLHALNPNWADEDIVLGLTGDIIARLIRHSRDYS